MIKEYNENKHSLSIFEGIGSRLEIHGNHGLYNLLDFEYLGFGNALDVGQLTNRGMSDLFNIIECVRTY